MNIPTDAREQYLRAMEWAPTMSEDIASGPAATHNKVVAEYLAMPEIETSKMSLGNPVANAIATNKVAHVEDPNHGVHPAHADSGQRQSAMDLLLEIYGLTETQLFLLGYVVGFHPNENMRQSFTKHFGEPNHDYRSLDTLKKECWIWRKQGPIGCVGLFETQSKDYGGQTPRPMFKLPSAKRASDASRVAMHAWRGDYIRKIVGDDTGKAGAAPQGRYWSALQRGSDICCADDKTHCVNPWHKRVVLASTARMLTSINRPGGPDGPTKSMGLEDLEFQSLALSLLRANGGAITPVSHVDLSPSSPNRALRARQWVCEAPSVDKPPNRGFIENNMFSHPLDGKSWRQRHRTYKRLTAIYQEKIAGKVIGKEVVPCVTLISWDQRRFQSCFDQLSGENRKAVGKEFDDLDPVKAPAVLGSLALAKALGLPILMASVDEHTMRRHFFLTPDPEVPLTDCQRQAIMELGAISSTMPPTPAGV
jgi:hypothetical protein